MIAELRSWQSTSGHTTWRIRVRLSVGEVRDPNGPTIVIQHHILSGARSLCNGLRDAFGQSDQDMVGRSYW